MRPLTLLAARNGARTLLVEDLTTDGKSKINFVQALRDALPVVDQRRRGAGDLHLPQDLAQGEVGEVVEHQAHGPVLVVLADEGDAAEKMRVGQRRHRDQEVVHPGMRRAHAA